MRVKIRGAYRLLKAREFAATISDDGQRRALTHVVVPDPTRIAPATRRIAFAYLSSTNSAANSQIWDAVGAAEATGLTDTLADVMKAIWRKQTVLVWHHRHITRAPQQQRYMLALLMGVLLDGIDTAWMATVPVPTTALVPTTVLASVESSSTSQPDP